ncbi:hypothetical protein V6R21_16605 [Limibacter armeniacum]|uniref:hypothetical protein n=1 Tax=Limibacter armeniacum TaxID=466084 RepID=UPI002FE56294
MQQLKDLLQEISLITLEIEDNYPELYQYLDENPITIPSNAHPEMDFETMKSYLQSLKELLKKHIETGHPADVKDK